MKKLILIAAVIIGIAAAAASSDGRAQKEKFARKLSTFSSIVKELQTNYVDTLDATSIMDKTIGALLYQIDPYTEYYPADNQDEILSLSSGKYAGVGSLISRHGNDVIFAERRWVLLKQSRSTRRRQDSGHKRRYHHRENTYRRG